MKVAELHDGIVLKLTTGNHCAWLTNDPGINLPSGDRELRFVTRQLAEMVPGISLSADDLIVYLGVESTNIDNNYVQLMRRVYVNGYVAVVQGSNFRYLEPHPSFMSVPES